MSRRPLYRPLASTGQIPTLAEFIDQGSRALAREHGCTIRAARDHQLPGSWRTDWWRAFRDMFEAGALPSARLWRSLSDAEARTVLRSSRALRDDALTERLVWHRTWEPAR